MIVASSHLQDDAVDVLVRAGAALNAHDIEGNTALAVGAGMGCLDVVERLLSAKASQLAKNKQGKTPLNLAVEQGHTDVIRYLADRTSIDGVPAVAFAASTGNLNLLDVYLAADASLETCDEDHRTPLILAAREGQIAAVKLHVDAKASLDTSDGDGNTALCLAATNGRAEVARYLLDIGAFVLVKNSAGKTPIILALESGRAETILAFMNVADEQGDTVVTIAVREDNVELLRRFIEAKAPLNVKNRDGKTHLILAIENKCLSVVELLIDTIDEHGNTAVMQAAEHGEIDWLRTLINAKASLSITNDENRSALMLAALSGHVPAVVVLLESSVSPLLEELSKDFVEMAADTHFCHFSSIFTAKLLSIATEAALARAEVDRAETQLVKAESEALEASEGAVRAEASEGAVRAEAKAASVAAEAQAKAKEKSIRSTREEELISKITSSRHTYGSPAAPGQE